MLPLRIQPVTSREQLTPDELQAVRFLLHGITSQQNAGRSLFFLSREQAQAVYDFANGLLAGLPDPDADPLDQLDTLDGHPFTANQAGASPDPTA